jgi:hypothetical protein
MRNNLLKGETSYYKISIAQDKVINEITLLNVYLGKKIILNVRDLTPHVGRIIYFDVIKVNINKA